MNTKKLIKKIDIDKRIKELGEEISKDYEGKDLVIIGVLKGSFIFLADLVRQITVPHIIDFIQVSSYNSKTFSSGRIKFIKDITEKINGKEVLLIEDIIDTGLTVSAILSHIARNYEVSSINVCSLLDKPSRRKVYFIPDYIGFSIDNDFVIGYGLDYDQKYRSLPYILKVIE